MSASWPAPPARARLERSPGTQDPISQVTGCLFSRPGFQLCRLSDTGVGFSPPGSRNPTGRTDTGPCGAEPGNRITALRRIRTGRSDSGCQSRLSKSHPGGKDSTPGLDSGAAELEEHLLEHPGPPAILMFRGLNSVWRPTDFTPRRSGTWSVSLVISPPVGQLWATVMDQAHPRPAPEPSAAAGFLPPHLSYYLSHSRPLRGTS